MKYKGTYHKARYMEAINNTKTRYDKKHLAAVYILTSYSRIWNKVKYYVKPNRIDFKKM